MKKIHKFLLTIFVLLPMQISFNNFGQSILHNEIDDTSQIETKTNDANIGSIKLEPIEEKTNKPNPNPFSEGPNEVSDSQRLNEKINDEPKENTESIITESVISDARSSATPVDPEEKIPNKDEKKATNENEVINVEADVSIEDKKSVSLIDEIKEPESILPKSNENTKIFNTSEVTGPETTTNEPAAETVTKSSVIEIAPPKINVKPDIESFEEWKDTKLKEKAKLKAGNHQHSKTERKQNVVGNKELEISDGDSGKPANSNQEDDDQNIAKHMQQLKNYASPDCGAKLIGNNPESNHPSHILSENKDDYMLNACNNKVWFAIELCEPIKISTFELANLELFSNVPKRFRVFASERFIQISNGKDWPSKYLIGTFEASNVRSVQKFSLKDALSYTSTNDSEISNNSDKSKSPFHSVYAKYVRFEMISHYGSQHYCPLTLLRIYGQSMSDEDDMSEVTSNEEEDTQPITNIKEAANADQKVIDISQPINDKEHTSFLSDVSQSFLNNLISIITHNLSNLDYIFNQFIKHDATHTEKAPELEKTVRNDFYKILCNCHRFDRNEFLDCCQCLPKQTTPLKKSQNERSFNWLNNKCGYYFLMNTNNNILLSNYLTNMKLLPKQDEQSYFEVTINRISYFIRDNWLQKQINLLKIIPNATRKVSNDDSNNEVINKIEESNVKNEANETLSLLDTKPADKEGSSKPVEDTESSSKSHNEVNQETDSLVEETESKASGEKIKGDSQDSSILADLSSLSTNNKESETTAQIVESTTTNSPISKEPTLIYGKENGNVVTRLNNRIKILELNMSLSSQYLEKLSQHYRLQMDEMETRFNFTTTALKEATRLSDTRDLKQHERIITLEKRLEIMQQSLASSLKTIDDLKFQSDLLAVSVAIIVSLTVLIEIIRKLFRQTKPTFKQNKTRTESESTDNHLLLNLLTQKQIEFLVEKKIHKILHEQGLLKKVRTKSFHAVTSGAKNIETLVPKLVDDFQQQFMSIA